MAFLFAVLLVAIATATRLPFMWIGASLPFATYFPAILIVALLAGTRAGAFAAVLSVVVVWWAFMEPAFTFQNPSVPQLVDAGLFLVAAAFVVWVASLYRAATVQLSNNERSLTRLVREKEAILESALDCFVTIDEGGRVVEFNPAAERTFGIRRSDAIGKLLADLIIPPELRDQHSAGMARYLATGNARVLGKRLEMEAIRLDGSRMPVEVSITASKSDGLLRFVGHIRDISEQKRASREIAELNAALEKRVADRIDMPASLMRR